MAKVVPIRKSAAKTLARANAYIATAFNLIALSKRRLGNPVEGRSVVIEFATEVEAKEFQNLIHSLPKRRPSR